MQKITEVAPPGKKAESWITSNKARFKKEYGDQWEPILYATAWKMFGKKKKVKESTKPDFLDLDKDGNKTEPMKKAAMDKKKVMNEAELKDFKRKIVPGLYNFDHYEHEDGSYIQVSPHGHGVYRDSEGYRHNFNDMAQLKQMFSKKKEMNEHVDSSEYVDKWINMGFDITVEDLPNDAKKFIIVHKGIETVITEPDMGIYKTADGKRFESFDKAIDHLLKNTFSDINVTESIDYLKRMAGIPKSEKRNLNESFTVIPDTIVYKDRNDISLMAQKLNEITNSDSPKSVNEETHYIPLNQVEVSEDDDMTIRELKIAAYAAHKILEMIAQGKQPERWNLSKITMAADYLTTVYTFMSSLDESTKQYECMTEEEMVEMCGYDMTDDHRRIANEVYQMGMTAAKMGKDSNPKSHPDFIHYVKHNTDYPKYKDIISKSWNKGYSLGRK